MKVPPVSRKVTRYNTPPDFDFQKWLLYVFQVNRSDNGAHQTRPNEFGSMTARKDHISPNRYVAIKDHARP